MDTQSQLSSPSSTSSILADNAVVRNQRFIIGILVIVLLISLLGTDAVTNAFRGVFQSVVELIKILLDKIVIWLFELTAIFGYTTGSVLNTTANVAASSTIATAEIADGALNSVGDLFRRANEGKVDPEVKKKLDELVQISQKPLFSSAGSVLSYATHLHSSNNAGSVQAAAGPAPAPQQSQGPGPSPAQAQAPAQGPGPSPAQAQAPASAAPTPPPSGPDVSKIRADLDSVINKVSHIRVNEPSSDQTQSNIQNPAIAETMSWCLIGEFENKRGCVQIRPGETCQSGQLYAQLPQCESN